MGLIKSVEESKLYQKGLELVYQKGLKTQAAQKARDAMGKRISAKAERTMEFLNKNGNTETIKVATNSAKALNTVAEKSTKNIKGDADVKDAIKNIAKKRAFVKDGAAGFNNETEALKKYNGALRTTKNVLGLETTGYMAYDYFVNPWMEQQYLMGLARAGVGVAGIGAGVGIGVVGSNIISNMGGYTNDYYANEQAATDEQGTTQNY